MTVLGEGAVSVLRVLCTYTVLLLLAEWLFWPPLESCKCDVNGTAEFLHFVLGKEV